MGTSTITRCPVCGRKRTRSNPANARYWLLLHAMADKIKPEGQQYSPETWHTWGKSKFLGCDDIKMPNGKTVTVPKSTAGLSVDEFGDYMMQIEQFANSRGVYLDEMPD